MKKLHMKLVGRLVVAMIQIYAMSVSILSGAFEVGASANSQESPTKDIDQPAIATENQTYNDIDSVWIYQGDWSTDSTRRAYGGQIHSSRAVENQATISITGSQFTLLYSTAPNYGKVDVYVDNLKIQTINQGKSRIIHQKEWNSPDLGAGAHVLTFVHASGKKVNIDAIKVLGPKGNQDAPPPSVPTTVETPTLIPSVLPSPTNSVPVESPTSPSLPEPTASPTPFEVLSPTSTVVPPLEPSPTASAIPSPLPSPTASLAPTGTSSAPINPAPTRTSLPTFTSTGAPPATNTPTVTNTATVTVNPTATSSLAPSTTQGAYYVSASGNNADGRSWITAWSGLNQVNWSIIQPGDTIYISGGTTGVTYSGGIQISKSGTANGYITIDIGANSPFPAGHSGTVTIDGGANCIRATGSYFRIRNLHCQHATASGLQIRGVGSVLENNTVSETYGQGLYVYNCTGCVVRGNRVTTFPNDGPNESRPFQTDGIVAYSSSDTLIERNWIRLTNQYESAHIDGIQASQLIGASYSNITIRYNYVENTKAATRNAQGIYVTQLQGDVKIIGNVVVVPFGNLAVASHLPNNSPVKVQVIGNTLKNGGYQPLYVEDDDPVIQNNIIWQTGNVDPYVRNGALVRLDGWLSSNPANIDNNLLYSPHGPTSMYAFYIGNSGVSWTAWQAKGLDQHGIFGQNPNLDNCLRPTSASPSVGKGAILAEEYGQALSLSLCGQNGPAAFLPVTLYNRIQYGGPGWDIGAYEFSVIE